MCVEKYSICLYLVGHDACPEIVQDSIQVFRERLDFSVENSVPETKPYSSRITEMVQAKSSLIRTEDERKTVAYIQRLVVDAEAKSEELKQHAAAPTRPTLLTVDDEDRMEQEDGIVNSNEVARTQAFNGEQVQEQEQEQEQEQVRC